MSTAYTGIKPRLSLPDIVNMSVGFFGIQFGWDLQRANMGRIYENLGANPDEVPILFLAAQCRSSPLSGDIAAVHLFPLHVLHECVEILWGGGAIVHVKGMLVHVKNK